MPTHTRRAFLQVSGACAASAWVGHALPDRLRQGVGARAAATPRIVSLDLQTSASVDDMEAFYARTLGLRVSTRRGRQISFAAGLSTLTFACGEDGEPFYHFAFNIPENKITAARVWQLERSPLLPIPADLRDPAYPIDVVDYRHWNAHSIFFFDPARNVVEYIARHDLKNAAPGPFGPADILYASEIGLIVDDVAAASSVVREGAGVAQYRAGSDQFMALGDEQGLLLMMRRGRPLDFKREHTARAAAVFPTRASVRGVRAPISLPGFPYEVVAG